MLLKHKIDLLIFDLDGTLTDSIPPAIDAIQDMLAELKYPKKSKEEIHEHVGFGEVPLVSGAIGSKEPEKIEKAMNAYFRHYKKERIQLIKPYPGVIEFLKYFTDKKKIVLSNKKHEFIEIILKNNNMLKYFDEILGGDTAPCLKPDPCTINELVKKYNVKKEHVLLIGDMTIDIETGKNAKILTCAVTYGFDDKEKLIKENPDFIVDNLIKLKDIIK